LQQFRNFTCIYIDLSSQGPDDGPLMDRNMSSCQ